MLERLAGNLAFSWLPAVRDVFRDLDPVDWEESDHNPIVLLAGLTDDRFERIAEDEDYVRRVIDAVAAMQHELAGSTWWAEEHPARSSWPRTSRPSSRSTRACRSTPAASACSRATISSPRPSSACRSSASGSSTARLLPARSTDGLATRALPVRDPTRLPLTLERATTTAAVARARLELAGGPVAAPSGAPTSAAPALPARRRRRRERLARLDHRQALRRRPRAPAPAGARARRRRRARAPRARARPDRLPHERGPLGVPRDRAGARR